MKTDRPLGWAIVSCLIAALCTGCGAPAPAPPEPALDSAQPLVAERIRDATAAARADPDSAAAWGRLGELYDIHRFAEPALECYRNASRLEADNWIWHYFSGLVLRESDHAAAVERFEQAARLQPDYAPLQLYLGFGYFLLEEPERAEIHYRRALELDPDSVNAQIGLARIALVRNDPPSALELLRQAAALAPQEAAVHHQLAQVHRLMGRDDLAERERALAESSARSMQSGDMASLRDPVRDEVTLREGASSRWLVDNSNRHLAEGRGQEALEALEQALAAEPDSLLVLLTTARAFAGLGDLDRARSFIERAQQLAPDNGEVHAESGNLLARAGQTEAAIEAYRRALELDGSLAEVRSNLAALMFQARRPREGLVLLRTAAEDLPANVDVQYNFAGALVMTGDAEQAARVLEDALTVEPDHVASRYLLGVTQAMRGEYEESVSSFRRLLEVAPDELEARLDLGRALWELGRFAESIEAFREALRRSPQDRNAARELAWSLAVCPDDALRDGRSALELAQGVSAQSRSADPRVLDVLAAAQAATGAFDAAVATASRARQIVERTIEARQAVADPEQRAMMQELLTGLDRRLDFYRRQTPYRDTGTFSE